MSIFEPADILLPKNTDMEKWAVIACDQFTSDEDYWKRVSDFVGDCPSTLKLMLPEVYLETEAEELHLRQINETMKQYLEDDLFELYHDSYIYVERTMNNGSIRKGIIGIVDLEAYDYRAGTDAPVRATEKTVLGRIPPRMHVREKARIELPHIIMLLDDERKTLIESVAEKKDTFRKLYDFDLMEGGSHIAGWLLTEEALEDFNRRFDEYVKESPLKYADLDKPPVILAVGDGNHSLATAKACYEKMKAENPGTDLETHPARHALVELENIHDDSQVFEAIHRVVLNTDVEHLLSEMKKKICTDDESSGFPIDVYAGDRHTVYFLDREKGELPVAILEKWLDKYLLNHKGKIDYIHDDHEVMRLAKKENSIGFLLPKMEKSQLFRGVISGGSLPRKTFSMGLSKEKRYYLEARKIR